MPKTQAKAISLYCAVCKSHEVADVATKAYITEVKRVIYLMSKNCRCRSLQRLLDLDSAEVGKDLSAKIANVCKDIEFSVENVDPQISVVRKDLQSEMFGTSAKQKLIRWMFGVGILGILSLMMAKAFLMPAL